LNGILTILFANVLILYLQLRPTIVSASAILHSRSVRQETALTAEPFLLLQEYQIMSREDATVNLIFSGTIKTKPVSVCYLLYLTKIKYNATATHNLLFIRRHVSIAQPLNILMAPSELCATALCLYSGSATLGHAIVTLILLLLPQLKLLLIVRTAPRLLTEIRLK
jgi:hypothetical protein